MAILSTILGGLAVGAAGAMVTAVYDWFTRKSNAKDGAKPEIDNSPNAINSDEEAIKQIERFDPETKKIMNEMLQLGAEGFREKLDFGDIAQEETRKFETQTIPSIAERFAGVDQLSSGAFSRRLAQAGTDLHSKLAAGKAQFGLQKRQGLLGLLQFGGQPTFDSLYQPARDPQAPQTPLPTVGARIGSSLATAAGEVIPRLLPYGVDAVANYFK